MTAPIGHNRPPFESADDLPNGLPKMYYSRMQLQAWRKVIMDKPLDIRGALFSAVLAMYEYMEPLPADDHMAMLRVGIHNTKLWRRVKGEMIALGLLTTTASGRLTNQIFEDEISAYVVEFRNRQSAALEREKKARGARATGAGKPPTNSVATRLQTSCYAGMPALPASYKSVENDLKTGSDGKLYNEINGSATTVVPERIPQDDHEVSVRARV